MKIQSSFICLITVLCIAGCTSLSPIVNDSVNVLNEADSKRVEVSNNGSGESISSSVKVKSGISGKHTEIQKVKQSYLPNKSSFVGNWKGQLSMIDHFHSLTLNFTEEDGVLNANYDFWGMNSKNKSEEQAPEISFSYFDEELELVLPDAGIRLSAKQTTNTSIEADVYWLGHSQKVTFSKIAAEEIPKMTHHTMGQKMNVAVLLFDDVDVLDWAGPLEVFVHAHSFNTYTVSSKSRAMSGAGYSVTADYTFDNMPEPDIVIIPGGRISPLFLDERTMAWIKKQSTNSKYMMSVCNASALMATTGLLNGEQVTTHQSWIPWMEQLSKQHNYEVINGQRFVDNGKIITTAGVSAGIDGALHIVAKLLGEPRARMTAKMIEYDWQPTEKY